MDNSPDEVAGEVWVSRACGFNNHLPVQAGIFRVDKQGSGFLFLFLDDLGEYLVVRRT